MRREFRVRSVDVWSEGDADGISSTFHRQCAALCTLYSIGLRQLHPGLTGGAPWVRIDVAAEHDEKLWIPDEPSVGRTEMEFLLARPDENIVNAEANARPELYLNWIDCAMRDLAAARGWDASPLADVRSYCLQQNLTARLESQPLPNPSGTHLAVLSLTFDNDGSCEVVLAVSARDGNVVGRTAATMKPFGMALDSWPTFVRHLQWTSDETVGIQMYVDTIHKLAPQLSFRLSGVSPGT